VSLRILGVLLNVAGVLALLYGGIPYKQRETLIDLGPLKATADVEKKAEIPPPVGAGLVAGGTALLLVASFGGRKKS